MARIIRFEKNKVFDLDKQLLYIDGNEVGKPLKGIPYRIIEYLAENSPNPLTQEQIRERCWKENRDAGSVSYHILKARVAIQDEKLLGKRDYKYIVECDGKYYCPYKIINDIEEIKKRESGYEKERNCLEDGSFELRERLKNFLSNINEMESQFLNAILYCDCKWGTCTYDLEPQITNTCEGILSILLSSQREVYLDVVDYCIEYLVNSIENDGLISKSLSAATVVPTSMFLYIAKLYGRNIDQKIINSMASRLWDAKDELGWGLYLKKMGKNANIGCTYWAVVGMVSNGMIANETFQKMLRSLFRYDNTYSFGRNINEINPKLPCLYATAMMYILYSLLSDDNKKIVSQKYCWRKSLCLIAQNFDNPFFLIEEEGIDGVNFSGNTSVHTASWNHITIHYCLIALSFGIRNNVFSAIEIEDIINRVEEVLNDNSNKEVSKAYWCGPRMSLEKDNRGKIIFPTMHVLMGMNYFKKAIEDILNNK